MNLFVRAVVTGFGLALGSAIFKEARERIGWRDKDQEEAKDRDRKVNAADGATDPSLQS